MDSRAAKKKGAWAWVLVMSHLFSAGLGVTLACLLLSMNRSTSYPDTRTGDSAASLKHVEANGFIHSSSPPSNNKDLLALGNEGLYSDEDGSSSLDPTSPSCAELCPCANGRKLVLNNIAFGIASSSGLWKDRKEYIKLWWKPERMRGYAFLEKQPEEEVVTSEASSHSAPSPDPLPEIRISESIDNVTASAWQDVRSSVRISRIVTQLWRMKLPDVAWFVLGDDDTIFCAENLVRVLSKYDHTEMHYLGSASESHQQNVFFSSRMAYGGAGIAISYELARWLAKTQDSCLLRYPQLQTSDAYLHACISELGIQMTHVEGFHQIDLKGNVVGLLESHPVSPFLSVHHLSAASPVFPGQSNLQATGKFVQAMEAYPNGFLQQTLCYDSSLNATISVAWGFTVRWYPGWFSMSDMERVERTFMAWNYGREPWDFAIDTRSGTIPICNIPAAFHVVSVTEPHLGPDGGLWVESEYRRGWLIRRTFPWRKTMPVNDIAANNPKEGNGEKTQGRDETSNRTKSAGPRRRLLFGPMCPDGVRRVPSPIITSVIVRAPVLSNGWFANPRRQCCKKLNMSIERGVAEIELGPCADGEVIAWR